MLDAFLYNGLILFLCPFNVIITILAVYLSCVNKLTLFREPHSWYSKESMKRKKRSPIIRIQPFRSIVTVGVISCIGLVSLLLANASTGSYRVEPEQGVVTAQKKYDDATAAGGGYVLFGQPATTARIVAVGDIASDCANCAPYETSQLAIAANPDAVFLLGDTTYHFGELQEFIGGQQSISCGGTGQIQNPLVNNWGRPQLLSKTYPAIGNHEYDYDTTYNGCSHIRGKTQQDPAKPFWDFYASRFPNGSGGTSGDYNSRKGYYSFDLNGWHIVVLNSECVRGLHGITSRPPDPYQDTVIVPGGCGDASPQYQWLQADLQAHPAQCTLAYWHRPVYPTALPATTTGAGATIGNMWKLLEAHGVDVILTGHTHVYQRIKPVNKDGQVDFVNGITQFVVGTGGAAMQAITASGGNIVAHSMTNKDHGILQADLSAGRMDFQFLPSTTTGSTVTDSGSISCH